MKRTLVIGDIHGGLKALIQVLEKAKVNSTDKLIFLGDYVDGWSESAQVLEYLMQLSQKQLCIFIKGNHDAWCEDWLITGNAADVWLKHGGRETIKSYAEVDELTRKAHLTFLDDMKYFEIDEQNRLFIHAGFSSVKGPKHNFDPSDFSLDRTLWETAIAKHKMTTGNPELFPKRLKLFKEIYIGHTPTLYYNVDVPMQGCNVWNLDTGAAFTGKLSIMDIDSKQFWQSEPVMELYPTEPGRNKLN